jgi:hypothetical protein
MALNYVAPAALPLFCFQLKSAEVIHYHSIDRQFGDTQKEKLMD